MCIKPQSHKNPELQDRCNRVPVGAPFASRDFEKWCHVTLHTSCMHTAVEYESLDDDDGDGDNDGRVVFMDVGDDVAEDEM